MIFSREEKIAHINKSPDSVAIHDKEKWLNIFSEYAIVEDPVGSKPHVTGLYDKKSSKSGNANLARFYETFIAPNTIVFDIKNDIVCKNHVVRDLTVNIDMQGLPISVPMHLLYELVEEKEQLKIRRLAAHWELMPMMSLLMSEGLTALPILTSMSARMMKHQGLSGAIGLTSGLGKLGKFGNQGKETVEKFLQAFNDKNQSSLSRLFCNDAVIHIPYGEIKTTPSEIFTNMCGTLSFSKLLLAGTTVTTSVTYKTDAESKSDNKQGVAIFEFDRNSKKIHRLTFYYE